MPGPGGVGAGGVLNPAFDYNLTGTWTWSGAGTFIVESVEDAITATAGGGQGGARPLTREINKVTVVATAGDSVRLPAAIPGLDLIVVNTGANPMQVFGNGTDTINGIATATGISQGINTEAIYICTAAGNWTVPLTALWSSTPQAISGAAPAIPAHSSHTYVFTRAGVVAATLAAPTATTDDGIMLQFTSSTANAHTITATGLLSTGTASVNVATFAAFAGASLDLMAYQGKWLVLNSNAITFS